MADSSKQEEAPENTARIGAQKPLLSGIKSLLADPKYSDLTVKCATREWKVHKAVVCPQSQWFAKACDGDFKEAEENIINIKEAEPEAVHAMLEYLYTCDFDDMAAELVGNALSLTVLVYHLAGQYLHKPLQDLAAAKLTKHANAKWEQPEFAVAIPQVYGHSPEDEDVLKKTIVSVAHKHAAALFSQPERYVDFHQRAREVA